MWVFPVTYYVIGRCGLKLVVIERNVLSKVSKEVVNVLLEVLAALILGRI